MRLSKVREDREPRIESWYTFSGWEECGWGQQMRQEGKVTKVGGKQGMCHILVAKWKKNSSKSDQLCQMLLRGGIRWELKIDHRIKQDGGHWQPWQVWLQCSSEHNILTEQRSFQEVTGREQVEMVSIDFFQALVSNGSKRGREKAWLSQNMFSCLKMERRTVYLYIRMMKSKEKIIMKGREKIAAWEKSLSRRYRVSSNAFDRLHWLDILTLPPSRGAQQ